MTFAQLKALLGIAVNRSDLANNYGEFVNGGIRTVEDDRSWGCMRTESNVTILNGTSSIALPARFKELQKPRGSVNVVLADGSLRPVEVVTEEEDLYRFWSVDATLSPDFRVNLKLNGIGNGGTLNLLGVASENLTFRLKFYQYLPDLSADSDHNWFTDEQWEMVLAAAKFTAFELINDSQKEDALLDYQRRFTGASKTENYTETRGRKLRL